MKTRHASFDSTLLKALLAACLTLFISATAAHADTTVYNSYGPGMTWTNEGDTGTYTLGPPGTVNYFGALFSPSSTVNLTSLTGNWAAALTQAENSFPLTHPVSINVGVFSDVGGQPGADLYSWTVTVDQEANNYTLGVSSGTGPLLVAGDQYWLVAYYTGAQAANNFLGWAVYTPGSSEGLFESDVSLDTMSLYTTYDPVLEVQGTPALGSSMPEPSTLLLLGCGLVGLVALRRS